MSIFKQWYLRLFKGYYLMDDYNKSLVELLFMFTPREIDFINLKNGYWLVSPPR